MSTKLFQQSWQIQKNPAVNLSSFRHELEYAVCGVDAHDVTKLSKDMHKLLYTDNVEIPKFIDYRAYQSKSSVFRGYFIFFDQRMK